MTDLKEFPVLFRQYIRSFLMQEHQKIQSMISFVSIFLFLSLVPFYSIEVLLLIAAVLAVVAYVRLRSSIIIGLLLGIPSYIYHNPAFGILGIFVSFWMIYVTLKDWKLGTFSMLITSFCSLQAINWSVTYPFASMLIITIGIFFGAKFGGILGITSALGSIFFLLGYGKNIAGLMVLPKVESLISPNTHIIPLADFYPRKIIDSFSVIYTNKRLVDFILTSFNSISGAFTDSFVIYINVVLWGVGGWVSGKIMDKYKKIIGWLSFPLAAVIGSFLIILSTLFSIRSLEPNSNIPFITLITNIIIFLCSTVLLSISFSPLFDYFDRFIASEWKKISQIISIARPIKTNDVSMSDIGGYNEVKQEIRESIAWPLERQDLISKYKIIPPRGVLLFGPPGCGKQKLMLAVANETRALVFFIKCKEILSTWENEEDMDKIFQMGIDFAPCLLMFMDIDAIVRKTSPQTEMSEMIFDSYLKGLDSISENPYVIPIGIMNSTVEIDDQVLAPGRLEKLIHMPLPIQDNREEIFKVHLSGRPISKNIDLKELAKMTKCYTDADIEAVCNQASLFAARRAGLKGQGQLITMDDLKRAIREIPPSCTQSLERSFNRSWKTMENHVVRVRIRQKLKEILGEK